MYAYICVYMRALRCHASCQAYPARYKVATGQLCWHCFCRWWYVRSLEQRRLLSSSASVTTVVVRVVDPGRAWDISVRPQQRLVDVRL